MIRVGMMVEVIHAKVVAGPNIGKVGTEVGKVGQVLREDPGYSDAWMIEGLEIDEWGVYQAFRSTSLREIKPPRESKDVKESQGKYLPTFDEVIRECNKPVKELV